MNTSLPPIVTRTGPSHSWHARFFRQWFARERTLATSALLAIACVPALLALGAFDDRSIAGISVWTKPVKFHIAVAVYFGTLAWYAGWVAQETKSQWWYKAYLVVLLSSTIIELIWLSAAAALGEPSHFNRDHAVLAPLYPLMGVLAVILTSATLFYAALLLLQSRKPAARERANSPLKIDTLSPTMCLAIPAGLVASFVLTVYIAGQLSSMDSHWIGGTRSDAAGIPLLGWSRDGGDLRVAHFFALHAMQFIPLFALLRWPSQSPASDNSTGKSTGIRVMIITLGYGLFVMALYRQAMNGNAFLSRECHVLITRLWSEMALGRGFADRQ